MNKTKQNFALRLSQAMVARGYEAKPAILERQFNLHYFGKPMTLHGVRRWLRGETLPAQDKLVALAEWLRIPPDELRYGAEIKTEILQERKRWDDAIGYQERETFEIFLALPAPQRKAVREIIIGLAKAKSTQ
jgi:transcriptional regulator with XRE-family HTH domain